MEENHMQEDNNYLNEREQNADRIIKNHVVWSMGAGLIPVPIADFFAVSAIQLDMIRQMCKLYEVDFKETEGKAVITTLTGTGIARLGARAVKFIPGVGSVIGGVTMAVLSGAGTYALGEVFKKHFETGGTFLDFDPGRLKKYYDEKFEKGKEYARKIRDEQEETQRVADKARSNSTAEPVKNGPGNLVQQLERLGQLRDQGVLTDEEFQTMKKKILDALD